MKKRTLYVTAATVSALLALTYAFFSARYPAFYTIQFYNRSSNVFVSEVRFTNPSTGVDEHIRRNIGNIRGPFPRKMTAVIQGKNGVKHERVFEASKYAPPRCDCIDFRILVDDVLKLVYLYLEGDILQCYDPLASPAEIQRSKRETEMCEAARNGDIACVGRLLDAGVSPGARLCGVYVPAVELAALNMHADILRLLVSRGAKVGNAIIGAAEYLDTDILEYLQRQGGDVNAIYDNQTPLTSAIKANKTENVEWLLRHGAQVNLLRKNQRYPPLILAVWSAPSLVPLLLEHGADPRLSIVDEQRTAIQEAIRARDGCADFQEEKKRQLDVAIEALNQSAAKFKDVPAIQ